MMALLALHESEMLQAIAMGQVMSLLVEVKLQVTKLCQVIKKERKEERKEETHKYTACNF